MAVKPVLLAGLLGLVAVVGCSSEGSSTPGIIAEESWVRSTDEAERPEMTAVFVNLTNPSSEDITMVSADCGDVAMKVELHEMVMVDGEMVMREVDGGLVVPKEGHLHLAPGGPHVMLMGLNRELPAGSEELACTLTFDNEQEIEILAPVKEFTEEQDTYHTHEPSED